MRISRLLSVAAFASMLAATSCVDDKYDFSDIDTTTKVSVNDLVVPIKIDAIQLKSVIDIDESDPNNHIKVIDGAYTYVQGGNFTTGNISVPPVTIRATNNSVIDFSLPVDVSHIPDGVSGWLPDISVNVPNRTAAYAYKAQNISDDICGLSEVTGDMSVTVNFAISGVEGLAESYILKDFMLQMPADLIVESVEGADYSSTDNVILINSDLSSLNLGVKCNVKGLRIPAGAFNESEHSILLEGEVGIKSGEILIHPRSSIDKSKIGDLKLKVEYAFSSMPVTSVDGTIKYQIDDVSVPRIDITDLPDVLAQSGTNLILTNPCLYLNVNNPLYQIGAYAQTGFSITANHADKSAVYSIDNPFFTIAAQETNDYCFSPKMPATPDAAFANAVHVPFASLSYVLSGDGLPESLDVDLINPCMPKQDIINFMLDHDYGKVHGEYKFVAPLQFNEGTAITYSDKVDGWSSEDLDKMTITRLDVNFTITTDVPVAVDFTGYPIDKQGHQIKGVTITGANINALANNQQVKISITGDITGLDGIEFVAKASAKGAGAALSPNMTIKLTDIRPCVSGYYLTEL